ncbi:Serine protease trypsin-like protein [Phytophthora palmivora]|uniref:Serine protease trypsin-like protein n=1 Tax=Phytophthora palmivora TaxID=4796 RepID=A0A2P4YRY9_9STRA|nr:Serine protease trypsin-like protein [Phytophthora palmivora]
MKIIQVGLFASMLTTLAYGFKFPGLSTDLTPGEENRIYGGSNARIDNHGYTVSLHSNGPDSEFFCAGTLITPNFILTAGLCLEDLMYNVYASLGSKHRMGGDSGKSEKIRVVEAFRHPSYYVSTKSLTVTHNMALLKLETPSKTKSQTVTHNMALLKLETPSKIQPVLLADADGSDNKPGSIATAINWGLVNDESSSDTLQTMDVEIITNAKCAKLYDDAGENTKVDDSVICAGTVNGKDMCTGEGGGPLIVNGVLVGIASDGPDDCGVLPVTFTRVSNALDFIDDVLDGKSSGNVTELLTAGPSIFNTTTLINAIKDGAAAVYEVEDTQK